LTTEPSPKFQTFHEPQANLDFPFQTIDKLTSPNPQFTYITNPPLFNVEKIPIIPRSPPFQPYFSTAKLSSAKTIASVRKFPTPDEAECRFPVAPERY
jgi:hypothetical protein